MASNINLWFDGRKNCVKPNENKKCPSSNLFLEKDENKIIGKIQCWVMLLFCTLQSSVQLNVEINLLECFQWNEVALGKFLGNFNYEDFVSSTIFWSIKTFTKAK